MEHRTRRLATGQRGQSIVLGALLLLVVTLSLFITLNVQRSVHERIRIQHLADAQSYSLAVQEARAYNFFAYSNRAIAGALVSMAILHVYMSEMSAAQDALFWMGLGFFKFAYHEFKKHCCVCPPPVKCCKISHCLHAVFDAIRGIKLLMGMNKLSKEIRGVDGPFEDAVSGFDNVIQRLISSQNRMVDAVKLNHLMGGPKEVRDGSAPQAKSSAVMLSMKNMSNFTGPFEADIDHMRRVMNDAANANRGGWLKQRLLAYNRPWHGTPPMLSFPTHVLGPMESKLQSYSKSKHLCVAQLPAVGGKAGITKGTGKASPNRAADAVGSRDWWLLHWTCLHHTDSGCSATMGLPFFFTDHYVYSNAGGGKHPKRRFASKPHSGDHTADIEGHLSRYKEFRPGPAPLFSQPTVYAHVKQDLAINEKGNRPPWEIIKGGQLKLGALGDTATLNISDQAQGRAVGKSLVYYHRPGIRDGKAAPPGWQEQPNFFHPYWRAKLHPFTGSEAAQVLGIAMDYQSALAAPAAP